MNLRHSHTLGGIGEQPQQFLVRLCGISVDENRCLLAVGDREVKRFSREGELEHRLSTHDAAWSLAAASGSLWLGMQGAIERLDRDGKLLESITDSQHLGRITSLAVHGNLLFAADATHNTIHLFKDGQWVKEVGADANTRGFMIPNGVLDLALDVEREMLFVAHSQKHRVERYDLRGRFIDSFGRFGNNDAAAFGGCCNPTNVAVLGEGLIATSTKAPPGIKLFTSDGQFVAQSGPEPFDPNTKNIDLVSDGMDRLYATDPVKCTIEVFRLEAPNT